MHMIEKAYSRLGDAYYGITEDDKKKINPAILAMLMQLLQMLLGGCGPAAAVMFVSSNPIRGRAFIRLFLFLHSSTFGGYPGLDIGQAVKALFTVASTSSTDEAIEFDSEMAALAA